MNIFCTFNEEEHQTWKILYQNLDKARNIYAHPLYTKGLEILDIRRDRIPSIDIINQKLMQLTGWQVVPAEGLVDGRSFFKGLASKQFPVGNFIRNGNDLAYTPAPDIFHDLYGHIPFYTNQRYARFCEEFGRSAVKHAGTSERLKKYERVFWFGVEFPLIKTKGGEKIFGGGILSSSHECDYSMSSNPKKMPFDISIMSETEYRIDTMQEKIFVLESEDQLYGSIPAVERVLNL